MKKLWFKLLYWVTPINTRLNEYAYNKLYNITVHHDELIRLTLDIKPDTGNYSSGMAMARFIYNTRHMIDHIEWYDNSNIDCNSKTEDKIAIWVKRRHRYDIRTEYHKYV